MAELAEIAAVEANPATDCLHGHLSISWQGIAADECEKVARHRALCEALERAATDLWWQGKFPAIKIDMKRDDGAALAQDLAVLRGEAEAARATTLFTLPHFHILPVSLAISTSNTDSRIIFGFGAHTCAYSSARSALLEMTLMELNLTDIPSDAGQRDRLTRLAGDFYKKQDVLFGRGVQEIRRDTTPSLESYGEIERKLRLIGVSVVYQGLPLPGSALSVWRARLVDAHGLGTPSPKDQQPLI